MPDDDEPVGEQEFEELWLTGAWPRVWRQPALFCFCCEDWHDPPECLPGSAMELLREVLVEEREPRLLVPAWHDRAKADRPTFGWCSDHQRAVTDWRAHDNGYV